MDDFEVSLARIRRVFREVEDILARPIVIDYPKESSLSVPNADITTALEQCARSQVSSVVSEVLKNCSICLERINIYHRPYSTFCGHLFGESCIFQWVRKKFSCPICRKPVLITSLHPIYFKNNVENSKKLI